MAEALSLAASVIAVIDLSAKVGGLCFEYGKAVASAKQEIESLQIESANIEALAKSLQSLLDSAQGRSAEGKDNLEVALNSIRTLLGRICQRLEAKRKKKSWVLRRFSITTLKWPFQRNEVNQLIQDVSRHTGTITAFLQIEQSNANYEIQRKQTEQAAELANAHARQILKLLPTVPEAAFDSRDHEHMSSCLPGTRVQILTDIEQWFDDNNSLNVFWLNGRAGTGKSTIARTVAQAHQNDQSFGGSFFFKRGEGDRGSASKLMTTLCYQLAQTDAHVAEAIKDAVESNEIIVNKPLQEQFEALIMAPLAKATSVRPTSDNLLLVMDALDECDKDDDIRLIISLFSRLSKAENQHIHLKLFVTSRPELPIRLGFKKVAGTFDQLILHDIEHPIIEHDIRLYLESKLPEIRCNFNDATEIPELCLPEDWPHEADVQKLARMATPLFIYASTVLRFISDQNGNPSEKLTSVLEGAVLGGEEQLSATYAPVLAYLMRNLSPTSQKEVAARFQKVVGTIILLGAPLSMQALSGLLEEELAYIHSGLRGLHSVLDFSESPNKPVRLFHLSFADFLTNIDPAEKSLFWVDSVATHAQLATYCINVMTKSLHKDMCRLKVPGSVVSAVTDETKDEFLSPELQYACRFWVMHLREGQWRLNDDDGVHKFLSTYFLYWVEVMCLLQRARETLLDFDILRTLLNPDYSMDIEDMIEDFRRVISVNLETISDSPLELYSSALVFAPSNSVIRRCYNHELPKWVTQLPRTGPAWDPFYSVHSPTAARFHSRPCFSWDSKLFALAEQDGTISVFSVLSGFRSAIKSGRSNLRALAFSPDDELLASTNGSTCKVNIHTISTGLTTQEIAHAAFRKSPSRISRPSVSFSPNGEYLMRSSHNHWHIWKRGKSGAFETLVCGDEPADMTISSSTFSADSKLAVIGMDYGITKIVMDETTEQLLGEITGNRKVPDDQKPGSPVRPVQAICIPSSAPGGNYVVCYIHFNRFTIANVGRRSASTKQYVELLKLADHYYEACALSPCGKYAAVYQSFGTLSVWDLEIKSCVTTLRLSFRWIALCFSANGYYLSWLTDEGKAFVWNWTRSLAPSQARETLDTISWDQDTVPMMSQPNKLDTGISTQGASVNGDVLITARRDQTIQISCRDNLSRTVLDVGDTILMKPVIASDGSIAAMTRDWIWLRRNGQVSLLKLPFLVYGHRDRTMAFSGSGSTLVATYGDDYSYHCFVWDLESGKTLPINHNQIHGPTNHHWTNGGRELQPNVVFYKEWPFCFTPCDHQGRKVVTLVSASSGKTKAIMKSLANDHIRTSLFSTSHDEKLILVVRQSYLEVHKSNGELVVRFRLPRGPELRSIYIEPETNHIITDRGHLVLLGPEELGSLRNQEIPNPEGRWGVAWLGLSWANGWIMLGGRRCMRLPDQLLFPGLSPWVSSDGVWFTPLDGDPTHMTFDVEEYRKLVDNSPCHVYFEVKNHAVES